MTDQTSANFDLTALMGQDAADVKTLSIDWLRFMQEGVTVEIHVRRWRATTRLTSADLGLTDTTTEEQTALNELMSLGEKYLMPAEYIKAAAAIESGARQNLINHGFKTYWGVFIPASGWAAYRQSDAKFEADYYALRDKIVNNWESIKADMLTKYAMAARLAFRRTVKLANVPAYRETMFVDALVSKVYSLLPAASDIYASYNYDRELRRIPLPALINDITAEAEATAGALKAEAAALRDDAKLEYDLKRELAESVNRQKETQITGFMRELVGQLQETAYNAVTDVLEAIRANDGTIHPRSIVQLKNMVEKVAGLNFWGDPDLAASIEKIKAEIISRPASERKAGDISARLVDIATVTRSTLVSVGCNPRSARDLGVEDIPALSSVRQARKNLGVTVEIAPLEAARHARNNGREE